jgi:hypothetical protein
MYFCEVLKWLHTSVELSVHVYIQSVNISIACVLQKLLTRQNVRRFHALIATPLFMMSALSNFYFFAGMSLGNHFMWRLFEGMRSTDMYALTL